MILPRDLPATAPPDPRSKALNTPTLLYSWWCTGCALVIILFRIFGRLVRNNQLFREDWIILCSIIPLFIRMGLVHVILIWGTNNALIAPETPEDVLYHRSVGARFVLVSRIFYAMFIWMTKWTISEFLKRLTQSFWRRSYEIVLRGIRIFLVVTFLAVVISDLSECQPFDHYWQVVPDPGPACRQGWAQLIVMGSADTMTDLTLVIFPAIIVIKSHFSITRKIGLILLFSLSIIPLIISVYRMPSVIEQHSRQQYRTVWASSEILAAAAVSNAIVLGSFLRDKGVKKNKYKPFRNNSTTDSMSRMSASASIRRNTAINTAAAAPNPVSNAVYDSDEDLFKGMCYRTSDDPIVKKPSVGGNPTLSPRPPSPTQRQKPNFTLPEFNHVADDDSDDTLTGSGRGRNNFAIDPMPSPGDIRGQRRVSFYDIGGLLENGDASSKASTIAPSSPVSSTSVQDFASSSAAANGSRRPSLRPAKMEATLSTITSSRESGFFADAVTSSSPKSPLHKNAVLDPPKPILRKVQSEDRNNGNKRSFWTSAYDVHDSEAMELGDIGGLLGGPVSSGALRSTADEDEIRPVRRQF